MNTYGHKILSKILTVFMYALTLNTAGLCFQVKMPDSHSHPLIVQSAWAEQNTMAADQAEQNSSSLFSRFKVVISRILAKFGLHLDTEALKLYAKWIVGAPILIVLVVMVMLLRPRHQKASTLLKQEAKITPPRTTAKPTTVGRTTTARSTTKPTSKKKLASKDQVLTFFFNLFKHQIDAGPYAMTQLTKVATNPGCPDEVYEMRIYQDDDWAIRRMSIGLLGQGGGSRSKCYYVIYDSHMVVKIPSVPITNFTKYNRQIAAEASIVQRLIPKKCIVPRVSVILEAYNLLEDIDSITPDTLEAQYVQLLESDPSLQEYLKIGSSFAFFMDLARHFFLSTLLEELHHSHKGIMDEVSNHPELLWDQNGFVCRYGEDAETVCHDLQAIYYHYENQLRGIVLASGAAPENISNYHLKRWFMAHLAGEKIIVQEEKLSKSLSAKIDKFLTKVIKENKQTVLAYRNKVQAYIQETRFSRRRIQLMNLSSCALELLAWIGDKGLAMRDLKPENLFVEGNPDDYPLFLNNRQKFSIGLIDVETAVAIDADNPDKIPQPQLAGTPLYATPTHLMSNIILHQIYSDLRTTLHLQDWYATIAIIYKIITGKNLFAKSATFFPDILRRLKTVDPKGSDLEQNIIRINRLYWNCATAEFQSTIQAHRNTLSRVEINIPKSISPYIRESVEQTTKTLQTRIADAVSSQTLFTNPKKQQYLLEAASEKIRQMQNKLKNETSDDPTKDSQRGKVLDFLDHLQDLKNQLDHRQDALNNLETPAALIPADLLLEAMFQRVFQFMYQSNWPPLSPALQNSKTDPSIDITTYQATM